MRLSAPRRAAVLGSPIAHSLSPTLYRAGFAAAGLDGWTFDALECTAEALPGLVSSTGPDWAGFAVTMPGKQAAAAFAHRRSDRVDLLGVANTLIRREDGWIAENTDVDGVLGALGAIGLTTGGGVGGVPALILGGGGTARAAVGALAEMSWDGPIFVAGRRPASTAPAREIADRLGLRSAHVDLAADALADVAASAGLVISTLPAGVADSYAILLAGVPAALDVLYHPWPTALAAARPAGSATASGRDMLLHQAFRQFELITGVPAPRGALRAALHDAPR